MAASYSSFLSTKYYSPVFNTALFDGPFRIYFSQAYEGIALKIYHLLQNHHQDLNTYYKKWCDLTKKHVFILIYPTNDDLNVVFDLDVPGINLDFYSVDWQEGRLIAATQPLSDEAFEKLFASILNDLEKYKLELTENHSDLTTLPTEL